LGSVQVLKKILLGVVALFVVAAAFGVTGGEDTVEAESGGAAGSADDSAPQSDAGDREHVAMGKPASDGQFRFVVKKFECGADSVGNGFMKERAQGEFCVATLRVKNTGDEARMLDASSQYLYDAQGREFQASSEASISVPKNNTFLEDINPGNSVMGKVVFDVPKKGFDPSHLELHDSTFSGGVSVSLKR
jgi:hypothetical protein